MHIRISFEKSDGSFAPGYIVCIFEYVPHWGMRIGYVVNLATGDTLVCIFVGCSILLQV